MEIVRSGKPDSMILCAPNNGAIPGLLDTDVIESTCDVTPTACTPHRFTDFDEEALELIRRVKLYERKAAKAILTKDRAMAVDAIALHPLVNSYSLAEELVDQYIRHNFVYSPDWN